MSEALAEDVRGERGRNRIKLEPRFDAGGDRFADVHLACGVGEADPFEPEKQADIYFNLHKGVAVRCLALSPDGKRLLTCDTAGHVVLWDTTIRGDNRVEDRALVRALSSALVNRVAIVQVRVDVAEWLAWAKANRVRPEVRGFITLMPEALMRPVPAEPLPQEP